MELKRKVIIVFFLLFLFSASSAFLAWYGSNRAHVVVEWTTASELNTAGFNIFRGLAADDEMAQLNTRLISPSPDALSGGNYRFEDRSAIPGQTYIYYVEEVESSGATSRFGPIEIQANSGGKAEGLIAFIMAGLGLVGLVCWLVWSRRQE